MKYALSVECDILHHSGILLVRLSKKTDEGFIFESEKELNQLSLELAMRLPTHDYSHNNLGLLIRDTPICLDWRLVTEDTHTIPTKCGAPYGKRYPFNNETIIRSFLRENNVEIPNHYFVPCAYHTAEGRSPYETTHLAYVGPHEYRVSNSPSNLILLSYIREKEPYVIHVYHHQPKLSVPHMLV